MNKPLFKHQKQTLTHLKKKPRFFDQSEPGTGKTRVEIEDFTARRAKNAVPAIVLATRSTLESAWADDFKEFSPDLTTSIAYSQNREKAFQTPADVYITNHDAVNWLFKQDKKFWKRFEGGTLIVDECFPAGTLIDTPNGSTPIEMLKTGDLVYTTDGPLQVSSTYINYSNELVTMELDNGQKITCTENHPFATTEGWLEARSTRNLSVVQLDIHKLNQQRSIILQQKLQPQSNVEVEISERAHENCRKISKEIAWKTKLEQRNSLSSRNQSKTQCSTQGFWSQTKNSWRKWSNLTLRKNDEGNASTLLGVSTHNSNQNTTWKRLSDSIQTRLRITFQKMGIGGGRTLSYIAETLGCQERFILGTTRVVNISRVKCTSPIMVFNLQINGPHNYSVGGILVHNCTAFKHHTSQRSKNLAKIAKHFEYRRMMSGLADPNGVLDLWHQYYLLDEGKRLGKSFFAFRSATCSPEQVGPMSNMVKWHEKEGIANIVAALVKDISIKHLLEECVDIPPNHEYTRNFELNPKHRSHYCDMQETMVTEANNKVLSAVNKAVLRIKLLQIASGALYNNGEDSYTSFDTGRYELVQDLAQEVQHSVIFFQWTHQRDELVKEATKRGVKYAVYDGKTSDKERAEITKAFQAGELDQIMAHPKSAAHGLTWVKGTRTIWASPTDNMEWHAQAMRRIYRIGQTQKTETIIIVAKDTYDEIAYERLSGKKMRTDEFSTKLRALI